jgi:hypothetical protein
LKKTSLALPAIWFGTFAVFILLSFPVIAQAQGSSTTGNQSGSVTAKTGSPATASAVPHTITLKFDYNFSVNSACTAKKPTNVCVKEFQVYNLTDKGERTKLFAIKAPDGATGMRKVTGKSDPLPLAPGQHMLAVAAVSNTGKESNTYACTTMIDIKQ